jgi:hypothetical protein
MGNIDFDEETEKEFRAYIPSQPLQELSFIIKRNWNMNILR